eukprot:TRINITY_DN13367_c0_g1_i6.p1 TRINITY_DN13367_c0_g1~~TRINITY_DN13367_c0_g1_i6.p1  ORF type:complete len:621 (-),score=41.72 TRINITY_DN13367_c0_g1_i6:667-2529(-)
MLDSVLPLRPAFEDGHFLCPAGHRLRAKEVTGGVLAGIPALEHLFHEFKRCALCRLKLERGDEKLQCKRCDYQICQDCANEELIEHAGDRPEPPPLSSASCRLPPIARASTLRACKYGASCYNFSDDHLSMFSHPDEGRRHFVRRACWHGGACALVGREHLQRFAHPGDRNYRNGLVIFSKGALPEFHSVYQLFRYFDPDESGYLCEQEFQEAYAAIESFVAHRDGLHPEVTVVPSDGPELWKSVGGEATGYVSFSTFAEWVATKGLDLPSGLDAEGHQKPCRFRHAGEDGDRCSCPDFRPVEENELFCLCGHRVSLHREERIMTHTGTHDLDKKCFVWEKIFGISSRYYNEGLSVIRDESLLQNLQTLLDNSHKSSDNWTRDRGCKLHGRNGCKSSCANKNRMPVPTGYTLVTAYLHWNPLMWDKYEWTKLALSKEIALDSSRKLRAMPVVSSIPGRELDLRGCNEWHLLHGASIHACWGICESNFRVSLAGTGATWKDEDGSKGVPLYGFGIYLAERITKADEYATEIPPDVIRGDDSASVHAVLVCRVVGGNTNVVETNEIEPEKLRKEVFCGPYHSVFGDREAKLKKPFREIVLYDKDHVYPEYLLIYKRQYADED